MQKTGETFSLKSPLLGFSVWKKLCWEGRGKQRASKQEVSVPGKEMLLIQRDWLSLPWQAHCSGLWPLVVSWSRTNPDLNYFSDQREGVGIIETHLS